MIKIDAHHHFWSYDPVEYDWIDNSMKSIRRDFLPADLEQEIQRAGIDGVVSVQARQTLEETNWLLDMATANAFIKGVVGWVPLADTRIHSLLNSYSDREELKAVRHVVQGEPAGFLEGHAFDEGISALAAHQLVYDILIFEHQLTEAIAFVDRHPEQPFVLDHIAKPRIKDHLLEPWAQNLRELAQRTNVTCKLSGLVTEADPSNWTTKQLNPYLNTVLEAFGSDRLMFGTDWPVCRVGVEYSAWYDLVTRYISRLSDSEQAAIMGGTAIKAYNL